MYTNPDTMMEVANILESFDEENLLEIFKAQITTDDGYTDLQINHLAPLYSSYQRVMRLENIDEEDREKVRTRFYNICLAVINYICAKYNIEIDMSWVDTNYGKLPALTMCMYQFFILDIFYVILRSLNNYISKNIDDLFNAFADAIQGKDVSTATNMKIMNPKYAAIVSSMYDVTDYTFTMMDNETILEYLGNKYVPAAVIKQLNEDGVFTGDFANAFANIYKDNLALRSKITFELIYKIKEQGYLSYNPLILRDNQITENLTSEDDAKVNTSIEDDVD